MGNSNSQEKQTNNVKNTKSIQCGAGYSNNSEELQYNIQKLVKSAKNYTASETIGFTRSSDSDIDFDSMREYQQNGGALDTLNVKPTRQRYLEKGLKQFNQKLSSQTTQSINHLKTDANTEDLSFLKGMIKDLESHKASHQHQSGGCGCSTNNDPADQTTSDTSNTTQNIIDYDLIKHDPIKGGSRHNKLAMRGGKKDESDGSEDDDDESHDDSESSSNDDDTETIDSDDDDNEDEDDEDEDEDSMEESGLSNDFKSSSSSYAVTTLSSDGAKKKAKKEKKSKAPKKTKKSKAHKKSHGRNYLSDHIGGESSSEIVVDYKLVYSSDENAFHGSDESSDQFRQYRNRNMFGN